MTQAPRVTRSVAVRATPDDVWDAMADPDAFSSWFGGEARLALRPAGTGRFVTEGGEVRLAVVEEVDPGRRIVFSWWPMHRSTSRPAGMHDRSRVTITIEPHGDETVVTVDEHVTSPRATVSRHVPALRMQHRPSGARRLQASATGPVVAA